MGKKYTRLDARKHRPKSAKTAKSNCIEKLVQSEKGHGGYTKVEKLSEKSTGRIHVPLSELNPENVKEALTRIVDGKEVVLQSVRDGGFETERHVSQYLFTVEIVSHNKTRRAFRRFIEKERIYFLDLPYNKTEQGFDKENPPKGTARIVEACGFAVSDNQQYDRTTGKVIRCHGDKSEKSDWTGHRKNSVQKDGYTIAIGFTGIDYELMSRLRVQSFIKRSYLVKAPLESNSSADHRLGEKLKHQKLERYRKQQYSEQEKKLLESFCNNRERNPNFFSTGKTSGFVWSEKQSQQIKVDNYYRSVVNGIE